MRRWPVLAGLLLALAAPASPAAAAPDGAIEVTLDQSRIDAVVGTVLTVESRIANVGEAPTDRLVAHLNVASLDGVYVDLEDWSAEVTRDVPPLEPGGSTALSWRFHAVNAGSFAVYVVLVPAGATPAGTGPLLASAPVRITVAGQRTLTAGGALPVVLVVPILLGLLAGGARYRVRRTAA